jgi:hypothetical protein
MKAITVKLASAMLASLALASSQAQAGGDVVVVNETDQGIHPWFRYNCWGPIFADPKPTGWVFFGGIGARGQFGWDFSDPFITDPACRKPKLEFTYTVAPDVSTPPDRPQVRAKFKFSPTQNVYMQAGEKIKAINLRRDHDEDDDD